MQDVLGVLGIAEASGGKKEQQVFVAVVKQGVGGRLSLDEEAKELLVCTFVWAVHLVMGVNIVKIDKRCE